MASSVPGNSRERRSDFGGGRRLGRRVPHQDPSHPDPQLRHRGATWRTPSDQAQDAEPRLTVGVSASLALAKQAQMARSRLSLSPYQAGMMVSGEMRASWQVLVSRSDSGKAGQAGRTPPAGVVKVEPSAVAGV